MIRVVLVPSLLCFGLLWAGCSEEPKSALGESCAKTADCVDGGRCIANTCVAGAASTPEEPAGGKVGKEVALKAAKDTGASDARCEAAKKLAGFWGWSSTVVGAHTRKSIGVNGYYQITITERDCALSAELKKTGFAKHTFSASKVQIGRANLELSEVPGFAIAATGVFNLVSDSGTSAEMSITLIPDNDLLWGHWRYEGKKWEEGGMWGAVRGKRDSTDRLKFKTWSDQPCAVQCALGCEMPRRQKEHDTAGAPFEACVKSCGERPRATPTLCKPRGTTLAPEDVGFKDKRKGWGWSDRCYLHYKAERLAYAEAACREGIKVAKKHVRIPRDRLDEGPSGDEKALKALRALHYNLAIALEKRGQKSAAKRQFINANWFSAGENKTVAKKLEEYGWKSPCTDHWESERSGQPCPGTPHCCYTDW
jgi:hypothetical protein